MITTKGVALAISIIFILLGLFIGSLWGWFVHQGALRKLRGAADGFYTRRTLEGSFWLRYITWQWHFILLGLVASQAPAIAILRVESGEYSFAQAMLCCAAVVWGAISGTRDYREDWALFRLLLPELAVISPWCAAMSPVLLCTANIVGKSGFWALIFLKSWATAEQIYISGSIHSATVVLCMIGAALGYRRGRTRAAERTTLWLASLDHFVRRNQDFRCVAHFVARAFTLLYVLWHTALGVLVIGLFVSAALFEVWLPYLGLFKWW